MTRDYEAEVPRLAAELHERDDDPAYTDAPVLPVYARISRLANASDDAKTIRQVHRCLTEMKRHHVRLGTILVDDDRSAWKEDGKREAWDALMVLIDDGEADGVAARFLDRLARQSWDLENALKRIERARGAKPFVFLSDGRTYDTKNPGDRQTLRNAVSHAQWESDIKSQRIRDKVVARLDDGDDRNGPSPFGHRWPSEAGSYDPEELERERDAIRLGYQMIIDGESWNAVARKWTELDVKPRRGTRWNGPAARAVLLKPRHAGYVCHLGEVIGFNDEFAIIEADTYDRFRRLLDSRVRGRRAGETLADGTCHIASTLARCGRCGRPLIGRFNRSARYPDGEFRREYRCPPRGECSGLGVDARAAERWLGATTVRILSDPKHAESIARNRRALADLNARILEFTDAITNVEAKARAIHVTRRKVHDDRIGELEAQLAPLIDERDVMLAAHEGDTTEADTESVLRRWNEASPAQRRSLARLALPEGFYVAPVGRGARIRGDAIMSRFSVKRGEANPRRADR